MTFHQLPIAAALAFATLCSPAWAVYKCKDPITGRTVFQERACEATGATGQKIEVKPASSGFTMDNDYGTIRVGMTPEEVVRSWGKADKVNKTVSKYGNREQWVYERADYRHQYVYFEDGVVTSISSN